MNTCTQWVTLVVGLQLYTDLEKYPEYQGGFIWDFIDQAIYKTLPNGSEFLSYGGDWRDRPSDYEFVEMVSSLQIVP